MTLLVDVALRSSAVLLLGLAAMLALRRRSAAIRHAALACTLAASALVGPLSAVVPGWAVPIGSSRAPSPATAETVRTDVVVEAAVPPRTTADASAALPSLALVWMAGVLVAGARLLVGLARLAWLRSRARVITDERWTCAAREVASRLRLPRSITLLATADAQLIATWGLLRPRLLLPDAARAWSNDRIRIVLHHELAHVRRRDWAVQLLADALRSLHWFNPLFWIACRQLRRESEQAADDLVIAAGIEAKDYAAHLLDIARRHHASGPGWAPAVPMARPSTLERRIAAMLNPLQDRSAVARRPAVLLAAVALCVTLPVAAFRAAQTSPLPLSGTVYDTMSAVVPGVALKLEDEQEFKWEATSDASGRFEFPPVQPGKYTLEAALPGFGTLQQQFELRNPRDWDRAITLQVGQVQETISVRAQRPAGRPAPAAAPSRVLVGGNIKAPMKVRNVNPVYPPSMREAGREGVVPIEAVIGSDGAVAVARVLSAQVHPDFANAALDAVRQWRFTPTLLNGTPVEVVMKVSIRFSLSD